MSISGGAVQAVTPFVPGQKAPERWWRSARRLTDVKVETVVAYAMVQGKLCRVLGGV